MQKTILPKEKTISLGATSISVQSMRHRSKVKSIFKLLAERLKRVISNLISPNQNGFIKGRKITDAAMVTNESLENLIRKKKRGWAVRWI